jgi:heterodisulfide reductase subunit A
VSTDQTVLVIGGGIAGLAAALELAALNIRTVVVEKSPYLGGHAALYSCKATDACVKCGACLVDEKRRLTQAHPGITVMTRSRMIDVRRGDHFEAVIETAVADADPQARTLKAQAVILAAGFHPFRPETKPYGYARFENVVTNLELERMLQRDSVPVRPSGGSPPTAIAFIQCVGSRDATLGHLWCSRVCCGSALRMARLIRTRRPEIEIAFFYIDIQSFGKDFETFYGKVKNEVRLIRTLPGDIYSTADRRLRVTYFDPATRQGRDDLFDMVVLSVGMTPAADASQLADLLGATPQANGFFKEVTAGSGVFPAGAVCGPMSIAESAASGGRAALRAAFYLRRSGRDL